MLLILHILIVISGSWLTFYLNRYLKLGAVKSSSLLALIIGGIYQINESFLHYDLPRDIPFLVIGSTFIGMITSRKHYKISICLLLQLSLLLFITTSVRNSTALRSARYSSLYLIINKHIPAFIKTTKKVIKPFRHVKVEAMKRNRHRKLKEAFK